MDEMVASIVNYTPHTYDLEALWTAADTLIGGARQFLYSHLKLLCCIVCCSIRHSHLSLDLHREFIGGVVYLLDRQYLEIRNPLDVDYIL